MLAWRAFAAVGALTFGLAPVVRAEDARPAEEPWQTISTGKVLMKSRPVKGSTVQEVWAETDLRASVRDLQDTLLDGESFARFMPYVKEARRLGPVQEDGSWLVYNLVAAPLVAKRDFVVRVAVDRSVEPDGSGVFQSRWSAEKGHVPPVKDVVRILINEGSWMVTPCPDGRSHVVYRFRIDPGGMLPAWLADIANRSGVADQFKAIEAEARRRGEARLAQR